MTDRYMFVYQEWDVLREKPPMTDERVEKTSSLTSRNPSFSVRLQEARIKQRMTVTELANKTNVPSRTMSLYENGTEMPPSDVYDRICAELGMND